MTPKIPRVRMRDVARIYDALEIGLIIADRNAIIIWANKYYCQLTKFDITKYYGKDIHLISQEGHVKLPHDRTMFDIIMETKQSLSEVVVYRTVDYVITTAHPIFDEVGEVDYIVYATTNYSELMQTQERLSQSNSHILALEAHLQNLQIKQSLGQDIIIADKKMYDIYGKALRLAATSVSVMLTGESGTGKDVLARFIHQNSPRRDEKFIHVNMATIPQPLFESELFGYTPGSFTGASRQGKEGLIQLANNGTLFLDEIGELPMDVQAKLLQVIQDKQVRSIGAVEPIPVNFRIICATNRDLKQLVREHKFRLDLYYRLNTIELTLPPLRNRREDIPLLATHFLNRYNQEKQTEKYLSSDVIQVFYKYSWPGNVRELQHCMDSLTTLCQRSTITLDQLPPEMQHLAFEETALSIQGTGAVTLKQSVELLETKLIREALARCATAAQAAEELGIDASTLSKKRKRYGI